MDLKNFIQSLSADNMPGSLDVYLQSLWYDGKQDWEKSHNVIQDISGTTAAWIHAYLHRKEGDIWNADYWYKRAGKQRPSMSLEDEWKTIAQYCLTEQSPQ